MHACARCADNCEIAGAPRYFLLWSGQLYSIANTPKTEEKLVLYVDMNLLEFQRKYSDEEACLQAIFASRWPRGYVCPYCGHNDGHRVHTRRSMQCCLCRKQSSITAGTIFEQSHIPLTVWFLMIFFVAQDKGGGSAMKFSKQLGMCRNTASFMLRKIRSALSARDETLTLAGFIEFDEALFGSRSKSKRVGKPPSTGKKYVLVLVENEGVRAGNLVMKVVDSPMYEDLKPVVAEKVESDPPGQWMVADGWGSHHVALELGHKLRMGHIPNDLQDKVLRCVSLAVSHARRFFKGTYHHYCKKYLQMFLDEFCYRWNRRHLEMQLASHAIVACAFQKPYRRRVPKAA